LKIASRLRSQVECGVELLDCMKPDATGKVNEDCSRGTAVLQREGRAVSDAPLRDVYSDIAKHSPRCKRGGKRTPTHVWIGSLCSYWYESVAEVCRMIRQALPDTEMCCSANTLAS